MRACARACSSLVIATWMSWFCGYGLHFERIQFRIAEDRPPITFTELVAWLALPPGALDFPGCGDGRIGPVVVGSHHASGQPNCRERASTQKKLAEIHGLFFCGTAFGGLRLDVHLFAWFEVIRRVHDDGVLWVEPAEYLHDRAPDRARWRLASTGCDCPTRRQRTMVPSGRKSKALIARESRGNARFRSK